MESPYYRNVQKRGWGEKCFSFFRLRRVENIDSDQLLRFFRIAIFATTDSLKQNTMSKIKVISGWICFIFSNLFWGCVYFMPFFPFSTKTKLLLGTVFAAVGEVLLWLSVFLLGKVYMKKIKSFLSPSHWFLKRKQ